MIAVCYFTVHGVSMCTMLMNIMYYMMCQ